MEHIIFYVIIIIAASLFSWLKGRSESKEDLKEKEKKEEKEVSNKDTRELFLDTLTEIGCQYELGEGDNTRIFFAYQGENFFADTNEDSIYVHIWDTHWGHVELYEIDELSRLRKAINNSNLKTSVITIYTIDEDAKTMDVHCKTTIPFFCSIPKLEDYLRVELNEFFRAHHQVGTEMHKLREQEQQA